MRVRNIPKDTQKNLKKTNDIDNFNLKLNKFAKFDKDYKLEYQDINKDYFKKNLEFYKLKINEYYQNIDKLNLNFLEFSLKTSYRLVIGAEQSIYETSIRLHHIYGIPFIPSTAIKGVLRSYYIQKNFAKKLEEYKDKYYKFEDEILFKKEDGEYKNKEFVDIFGSQNQEGKVIFFDAFPISQPKIKVDIMNPHYGHYYNKGKAPTDTNTPVPINFLTIENTKFGFIIASKEKIEESFIDLFKETLQNHGIGAKSAVGYGYFDE